MEPIPETHEVLEKLARRGDPDIAAELASMGQRVRDIVPDCVGLSLALLHEELTLTLVASSEEIAALDAVQYLDGGPCVEAAHTDRTVEVSTLDLLAEERWQMYAQATTAVGVASSLTLPILRNSRVVGSVNLYAAGPTSFAGHHEALAAALGGSAELTITNADLSFRTRLEAAQAPTRLADQDDVDIAVSIITAHDEVDTGTARNASVWPRYERASPTVRLPGPYDASTVRSGLSACLISVSLRAGRWVGAPSVVGGRTE